MRLVAHLLSVLLLAPGLVIAAAILAIGHLTSQPDFVRLLGAMLDVLIAFFPLAFLAIVLWFALALAGFSVRARRAAAVAVAAIAVATSGLIVWSTGAGVDWSEAGVHLPNACALVIATWLASTDWPAPARTMIRP